MDELSNNYATIDGNGKVISIDYFSTEEAGDIPVGLIQIPLRLLLLINTEGYSYVGGEFVVTNVEYAQTQINAILAEFRWNIQNTGMTYDGVAVSLTGEVPSLAENAVELNWKGPSGFLTIPAQEVTKFSEAFVKARQNLFDTEKTYVKITDAYTTLEEKSNGLQAALADVRRWYRYDPLTVDMKVVINGLDSSYYHASEGSTTPTKIPEEYDGLLDWDVISDEEKATRGWVKANYVSYDYMYNDLLLTFSQEGDTWIATTSEVEGTVDKAVKYAKDAIKEKQWHIRGGGVYLPGIPLKIPTDDVAKGLIGEAANAYLDGDLAAEENISFPIDSEYVILNKTQTLGMKSAIVRHVQDSFTRRVAMYAAIDELVASEATSWDIKEYMETEFDLGWPSNDPIPA